MALFVSNSTFEHLKIKKAAYTRSQSSLWEMHGLCLVSRDASLYKSKTGVVLKKMEGPWYISHMHPGSYFSLAWTLNSTRLLQGPLSQIPAYGSGTHQLESLVIHGRDITILPTGALVASVSGDNNEHSPPPSPPPPPPGD